MLHNNFPTRFSARIGKMLSYKNDKWERQAGRGEATSKSRTGWHVLSWHTHVAIMRQVQHTCKNVICLSIISMSFSGPCSTHTQSLIKLFVLPYLYHTIYGCMCLAFFWVVANSLSSAGPNDVCRHTFTQ